MTKILMLFYDFETTGCRPYEDVITEIGCCTQFPDDDEFQMFVNEGVPISKKISEITSITNDMIHNFPPLTVCMNLWFEWIQQKIVKYNPDRVALIAHNNNTFDSMFIIRALYQANVHPLIEFGNTMGYGTKLGVPIYKKNNPDEKVSPLVKIDVWFDTLEWVRQHIPYSDKLQDVDRPNSLGNLYQAIFGKALVGAHRALADCIAMRDLFTSDIFKTRYNFGLHTFIPNRRCSYIRYTRDLCETYMQTQNGLALKTFKNNLIHKLVHECNDDIVFLEKNNPYCKPKRCALQDINPPPKRQKT